MSKLTIFLQINAVLLSDGACVVCLYIIIMLATIFGMYQYFHLYNMSSFISTDSFSLKVVFIY